ncbi:MAG: hypothetical protein ABI855_09200 [Bacteroidota bacterium]
MIVSEITLFNTLRAKLGEQDAQTIVEGIKQEVKNEFDYRKENYASKEDISKLDVKISDTKAELIKWMFIFWVGQLASMIAIIKLIR